MRYRTTKTTTFGIMLRLEIGLKFVLGLCLGLE